MLRQPYLVDEIEGVVKDFVRRGTLEYLGQQGYDAFDYHGVTVGGEVDVSRVVHGGIKPHAALASFNQAVGGLELFVHRLELVAEVYEEAVGAGDSVVVITIASKLSGTYQSATIAAEDYPGKVFVVDSRNVAIGAGILVQYALDLVDQGLSAEELFDRLLQIRSRVRLVAVVDTLEYLHKGGRISKTVAVAGGLLAIKPVISVENGELKMINKARGNKQANAVMNKEIDKMGGADRSMPILLGYTGRSDELLRKYIAESEAYWNGETFPGTIVGSTVGTHAGPGAVAAAFFINE